LSFFRFDLSLFLLPTCLKHVYNSGMAKKNGQQIVIAAGCPVATVAAVDMVARHLRPAKPKRSDAIRHLLGRGIQSWAKDHPEALVGAEKRQHTDPMPDLVTPEAEPLAVREGAA